MSDFTSLALDLGSTFGYAKGKNAVIETSGEVALSATGAHPGHRWMKFQAWLAHNARDADEILYEDVPAGAFKSGQAAKVYFSLLATLEIFCVIHGKRMCSLKPSQVKKDFTGAGNAKKEDMCEVAMNLGWLNGRRGTRDNNNEGDAVALYWCIMKRRLLEPRFAHDHLQTETSGV